MRIAIVRTDIQKVYLSDIENSSQRDFSSEPKGQSRYFARPSDAQLTAVLNQYALATLVGGNTQNFDTTISNGTKLNIRTKSTDAYKQVTVRSGAAVTAAQIVADLNVGFRNQGVAALARAVSGAVVIDTTSGGPGINLDLDASSPSTAALQSVLGLSASAVPGVTLSALKAAVYPTASTANVASATILALGSLNNMSAAAKSAMVSAVQELVAPRLVETSLVLRSYAYGVIAGLRSSSFQPGGGRSGLPAKAAAYLLADDGSTAFSL
jgi:hypothetical protein